MKTKVQIGEEIGNQVRDLMEELRIGNYSFKVKLPGDPGFDCDGEMDVLGVSVTYPYREVVIHVGEKAIEYHKKKNPDLRLCVLHEIFHILHWKYKELALNRHTSEKQLEEEEEDLADVFASIVNRLL